jgi:uncharacterized membrane protein
MSEKNTLLAVLSYIGPLVLISYVMGIGNPFVKFHIKQGLTLLVLETAIYVLSIFLIWHLWFIYQLLNLFALLLAVLGIINAVQNKEKALPVIGQYAHHFKI